MADMTPMRKQYLELKSQNPDCLLFFRLGDFYEMFDEDAQVAARELDLTLTTRDRGKPSEEQTPMCGVPYHSCEGYISRLIAKGYKVAICEQVTDPALAKGLVEREVVRIVTPGTVVGASMLEEGRNNYIAGICLEEDAAGLCICDVSTGELLAAAFAGAQREDSLANELGRFAPREAVLSDGAWGCQPLRELLGQRLECRCENGGAERFALPAALGLLEEQFPDGVPLPLEQTAAVRAAGGLLAYLRETQKNKLEHIRRLEWYTGGQYMELDLTARRNLELTETLRSKEKRGSLLWVLDKTRTAMGGRLLRAWLERPLTHAPEIESRLEAVEALAADLVTREELGAALRPIADLERLMGRVAYGTANGRDLNALADGLAQAPRLSELLEPLPSSLLGKLARQLDGLPALQARIRAAIVDDPPFSVREGGLIRPGWNPEVDSLQHIRLHGRDVLAEVELREREATGIKSLKVGYNKVFGYYLEVSKSYYGQVPEHYVRKQTLANCERYITQELKELEHTVLTAQDRAAALEFSLFTQLREEAALQAEAIQQTAAAVAQADALVSLASVAAANHYCRPQIEPSGVLELRDGRHPVVEQVLKDSLFVANDTDMDSGHTLSILTGPNMAGKSTYMRQVALICLMAQMGSFVPARQARLGIVDRIFTRIGASDDLTGGQSTFMVEMSEVAQMMRYATRRSLILLDEIGRGTSTYDGMAIARAVLEYCASARLGARTLFATHYHELTVLEGQLPGVKNYNIAAKKRGDGIVFLRKIVPGGADRSYGIEVAQLAGLPSRVVQRARAILQELEQAQPRQSGPAPAPQEESGGQLSLEDMAALEAARQLRAASVETMTPLEALNLLYALKQKL